MQDESDIDTGLWTWALLCMAVWGAVWTVLWLRHVRTVRRNDPDEARFGPSLVVWLVTLNHFFLLFAGWWAARLAAALLFPNGPLHWGATLTIHLVIVVPGLTHLDLTFGPAAGQYSRTIQEMLERIPFYLVRREISALTVAVAMLLLVDTVLPVAQYGQGDESWSLWNWCVRWLVLTALPFLIGYAASGNWRLVLRRIRSRQRLLLFACLLIFVQVLISGRAFMLFVAWWLLRAMMGRTDIDPGIGLIVAAIPTSAYAIALLRTSPTATPGGTRLTGHAAVASNLLHGGASLALIEVVLILLHLTLLLIAVDGIEGHPIDTLGLLFLTALAHMLAARRFRG